MATQKYYVSKGKTGNVKANVTTGTGSAITGGLLELTVDLAVTASKADVIKAGEAILDYIRVSNWPPA